MLTNRPWRELPPPDTCAVDPACLPTADEAWAWQRSAVKCLWERTTTEWSAGRTVRIGTACGGHRVRVNPWPELSVSPDERGLPEDLQFLDGLILSPALAESLRLVEESEVSASGGCSAAAVLADLGVDAAAAARSRSFSASIPPNVLEDVACWPCESGKFTLAAAFVAPGFSSLLRAHPQLAWLAADRMFRQRGGRTFDADTWETIIGKGPLWLVSAFLGLPRERETLSALHRLHGDCFYADGLLETLRKVFARRESRAAMMRLAAPVRDAVLCLLEDRFVPHPDLLSALQSMETVSEEGRATVGQLSRAYRELSTRIEFGGLAGVDLSAVRSPERLRRIVAAIR